MFEPSKNPNPIILEIVHLFNLKRWKKTYDTNVNHNFEDVNYGFQDCFQPLISI
jgi:hypothetical protein